MAGDIFALASRTADALSGIFAPYTVAELSAGDPAGCYRPVDDCDKCERADCPYPPQKINKKRSL